MIIFDYIKLFYEWKKNQGKDSSDAATALYFYILKEANRQFWPALVEVSSKDAKTENAWGSKNTFHKALSFLRDYGIVEVVRQGKNEATPTLIRLLDTVSVPQNGTAKQSSVPKSGTVKIVSVPENGTVNETSIPQNGTVKNDEVSKSGTLEEIAIPKSGTLEAVSVPENGTAKGTIGVINTSSKTLEKEDLEEEDKKGDSDFFENGETPPFVQANREKIKNLIPVGPSPSEVASWLFQNSPCREHACLKIKSIKRDSDEDYREFIDHFIRYNGARKVQWGSFEEAAEHFMKTISSLSGFNPAKDNPQTHGKSKPKSGSLIPVASESRPKPEPGGRKPGKFSGIEL